MEVERSYGGGERRWDDGLLWTHGFSVPNYGEHRSEHLPDYRALKQAAATRAVNRNHFVRFDVKERAEISARIRKLNVTQASLAWRLGWSSTKVSDSLGARSGCSPAMLDAIRELIAELEAGR